jgi:dUTP pyrophosphatase
MLPDEYLGILPRSGQGFKYSVRLCNTEGIIDADYYNNPKNEGLINIKLHNQGNDILLIPAGEAFCQGIFKKYLLADGDSLEVGADRVGGIGSTSKG